MAIQTEIVIHHHDGADLHGLLVWDNSLPGRHQTVMIAHAWAGRGENEVRRAHQLAELGYAVFAIDLYGDAKLGASKEENAALMQPSDGALPSEQIAVLRTGY